ncbi:MAG: hypothetical protein JWO05_1057 [Gemmatimonadetes bacterium]|nr:hypothetical protein [Gemmatimonadota bacterium]
MIDNTTHPQARWNALSAYGATGFLTAAVVHVASYTANGMTPSNPLFWILHVAIFPLFFAFVFRLRAWQKPSSGSTMFRGSQLQWKPLLRYFPPWMPAVVAVLFAYVMLNFFLASGMLSNQAADHDTHRTTLDPASTVRAFSGHWLIFYALPTLFFLYVPAKARASDQDAIGSDPAQ